MVELSFAELLAQALDAHGLSKKAAAAALGVDRTTLHRWLSGEHEPSIAQRDGLAGLPRALGMSPAESERFLAAVAAALGYDLRRRPPPAGTPTLAQRLHYGGDDLPPFAGRAAELAALQRMVLNRRAVLITGMGGMGKTRLAQELLRVCAGDFDNGCEFLTLDPTQDAAQVLRGVAARLGVALPEAPGDGRAALARLRQQLSGIDLLFLIDNVASADQVRDLAQGLPAITWIFTARRASLKRVGVYPLALRLPGAADAAAIFRAHLPPEAVPDRDDDRLVARVVDRVGGLPVALRLAAAALANDLVASLAELDAWLVAGGLARAGSPTRKLERLFDGMIDSLPAAALRTLLLCGAFATPTLRLSAAQAVGAAAGARPTPDDWAVLADYALVDYPDDAHVALHALLHAHARRRPAAQPYAAAVRAAYVAHYLSLAEAVSRDGPALQRDHRPLLGEEPNLLAAAEALAAADDRAGLRRLWPASTSHLWQLGDHRAFERFDRLCLAAARADGDLVWAADILGEVGYVKLEAGEWAAAEGYFLEAQTIHDAAPDVLAQARLRRYRAQVALGRGQTEPALALLDEAGRLLDGAAGAEGETLARMLLHSARMTAYHRRGDLAAAAAAGQETERLFGRAGVRDDSHYGEFRVELGDVLLRLGRAEEAERQWATYVAARGDLPHRPGHAQAQLRLARLAAARGQPERAAELLRAARQTLERHGLPADEDWPAEDADDAAFR